jgi:hypothetical protein
MPNSAGAHESDTENAANVRLLRSAMWSAGSACSKVQVLNPDVYGVTALIRVQRQSVNSNRPEFLPMMRPVRAPDRDRDPRSRSARLHFLRAKLHFLSAKLDVS